MSFFSKLFKKNKTVNTSEDKQYIEGLTKSRAGFVGKLSSLSKTDTKINDQYFEDLFALLIEADVGAKLANEIIDKTKKAAIKDKLNNPQSVNELLIYYMFNDYLASGHQQSSELTFVDNRPTIALIVGVNGSGKTTSIAKLAQRYKNRGKKVLLVAGDTFRAGAIEQLTVWAKRVNCPIIYGQVNEDPGSVVFKGIEEGKRLKSDLIIIDTAGRVTNKVNLMAELSKIHRIIGKHYPDAPDEVLLVLDATNGQNGIIQAQAFYKATPLTGVIMSKMDGTSKGGILLAVHELIKIPIRFIGLGEKLDDLLPFNVEKYLRGLLEN
jgi:fused signal recognition particle receptor